MDLLVEIEVLGVVNKVGAYIFCTRMDWSVCKLLEIPSISLLSARTAKTGQVPEEKGKSE
jgi:hypothetical protein